MKQLSDIEKSYLVDGRTGQWQVVIGLEVHAQITSASKLFSGASTLFGGEPNEQVAFLDAGMPGMLPVINKACVDQAVKTGLGLSGRINLRSVFERKNYFYPDLPTGYQISQLQIPLVEEGHMMIDLEESPDYPDTTYKIRINRLHVEQDAGKSIHDLHPQKTFIDLNRAGIALMEIVSEPDMRSSAHAVEFVKNLRSLMRYLGTCDGNMEQGSLRADANVSLCRPGHPYGTRAEIKNINSIRFLKQAIEFEIARQMDILEAGGKIIQETRLFDPVKGETRSMRSKEEAHDYRYFPDPDLPPLIITKERVEGIRNSLPELPEAKRQRFMKAFELSHYDANVLVSEKEIAEYYEQAVSALKNKHETGPKLVANWLMGDVFAAINKDGLAIEAMNFKPVLLAQLVDLILDNVISGKIAKDVFSKTWETGKAPADLVKDLGLEQITDTSAIEEVIDKIISQNADKVAEYRSGKDKLFGFFVGLVMKETKGKANPALVNDLLQSKLAG